MMRLVVSRVNRERRREWKEEGRIHARDSFSPVGMTTIERGEREGRGVGV
jgi:hypothetical protein